MEWVYDDGGRFAAGHKGDAGDCACRAVAITTQREYEVVYKSLNRMFAIIEHRKKSTKSSARTGVDGKSMRHYMESIGWTWKPIMAIGSGCTMHMRGEELPRGRIIVSLSKHYAAVIDGVLHDTYDCTREGTRCVYGYFYKAI